MITSETFSAIHLRSIELDEDIAKNCKLRSKFMHETIVECKNVNGGDSINISIGRHGMDILSQNNVFLESHPISQVSYSVCDKSSHQFAIVSRQQLPPNPTDIHTQSQHQHVQMCHVFRFNSPAEADSVNRHFGSLFKLLHEEKRKAKKAALDNSNHNSNSNINTEPMQPQNPNGHSQVSHAISNNMRQNASTPTNNNNSRPETRSDLPRRRSNNPARRTVYGDVTADEDWEKKLRRISSPLIEELISAASNNSPGNLAENGLTRSGSGSNNNAKNGTRLRSGGVTAGGVEAVTRRLSLCVMPTNNNATGGLPQQQSEEGAEEFEDNEPIHDLIGISGGGGAGAARKRRTIGSNESSNNGSKNRISAVFERFSFRTSSVGAGSSGNNGGLGGGSGRASRDVSVDCLKSGSPVVLLKERIESGRITPPELNRQSKSIHNSGNHQDESKFHQNTSSQFINNKAVVSNNSNIIYPQASNQVLQDCDEIAPEPPVRIHSLRQGTNQISTPINSNINHPIKTTGDVDLSPITTPSTSSDIDEFDDNHHHPQQQQQPAKRHHYHQNQPQPQHQQRNYNNKPIPQDNYPSQQIINNNNIPPPVYTPINSQGGASMVNIDYTNYYYANLPKDLAKEYLLQRDIGDFVIRDSASQPSCLALSVKVGPNTVSHYIIANCHNTGGFRIVGLDKSWPNLNNLITHLSVIPELLPCPLLLNIESNDCNNGNNNNNGQLHTAATNQVNLQQYQQLSEFSSIVASLDLR